MSCINDNSTVNKFYTRFLSLVLCRICVWIFLTLCQKKEKKDSHRKNCVINRKEIVCVCVWERERECVERLCVCVCVFVCDREQYVEIITSVGYVKTHLMFLFYLFNPRLDILFTFTSKAFNLFHFFSSPFFLMTLNYFKFFFPFSKT